MLTIKDCLKELRSDIAEAFEQRILDGVETQPKTFGLGYNKTEYFFDCKLNEIGELKILGFDKREVPPVLAIVGFFGYSQLELTPEIENKITQLKEYANQLGFVIQDDDTERKPANWTLNYFI